MNAAEMKQLLAIVYANYQGQIKDPKGLEFLWLGTFGNRDANAVTAAVMQHMRTSRFLPKVSEIEALLPALPDATVRPYIAAQDNAVDAYLTLESGDEEAKLNFWGLVRKASGLRRRHTGETRSAVLPMPGPLMLE